MMTIRDEQRAKELDAFLTAQRRQRPSPPVSDDIKTEARLAEELLHLASEMEPEASFLADLEAQLAAAASRQTSVKTKQTKTRRTPFGHNFIAALKEEFAMKQIGFALAALAVIMITGYFAWSMWPGGPATEQPAIIAVAGTPTTAAPDATVDPSTLPSLPSLAGSSGLGGGRGGAGGGGADTIVESSEMTIMDPLAEAEFTFNAPLPAEPTSLAVYEQPGAGLFTLEDVARFAELFGVSGPIYVPVYPAPEDGQEEWTPETFYQMFDGRRTLSVSGTHVYFYDEDATPDFDNGSAVPSGQAIAVAEAYLREKGLLDFPYEAISPYGSDVEFRRVIDGRLTLFPELYVSVGRDGRVWSVSYSPLSRLTALGDYPLRSAQEAWQLVLDEGVDYQRVFFNMYPGPDYVEPPMPTMEPFDEEKYRFWQRTYEEGEVITFYPYLSVHQPVAGGTTPRIQAEQFILTGPEAELQAMAAYVGRQISLTGTVRGSGTAQVLELAQWAPDEAQEYAFREGTIQREGEQTTILTDQGETALVPSAPADLADGERVYISGWLMPAAESELPVFNWQGMGRLIAYEEYEEPEMPEGVEPDFGFNPWQINQVTIDGVELVYVINPIYEEGNSNLRYVVQPAWRFKGQTDTQQIIEIFVQAVAEAFAATPETPSR